MTSLIFRNLVNIHKKANPKTKLSFIKNYLVCGPKNKKPFWDSYIPFVGPFYKNGGILLVGTAQSLAKLSRKDNNPNWNRATGLPNASIYRLYRSKTGETLSRQLFPKEISFKNIAIQPYEDGIFAAIAGTALAVFGFGEYSDLNKVTKRVSVTNFFKHSLKKENKNDLNPLKLNPSIRQKYIEKTRELYIQEELKILQPKIIVAFNKEIAKEIRKTGHKHVFEINDPAWLKRGGSFPKNYTNKLKNSINRLHSAYIKQMTPSYRGSLDRTKNYLAKYYLDFIEGIRVV